ncbi:STAS domain-containing protein [Blastococcus sp. LR1]|uniref:STAS domain-containing protein n=1 Tax=Blastococcus sp. LR1 TaxID=2877000 RepID=UPI001CCF28C0|nr:STAS domain-containing protein [Blastococcus sp. LR1]MCA0145225.1 STAS domain-containing protein [Blastococcus sp. LR1]
MAPSAGASAQREPDLQPTPFHVSVDLRNGCVAVAGELDRQNAPHVLDGLVALTSTAHRRWSVDTSAVTFCDAAGLRLLVTGHNLARRHGCELVLDRPSPCVHRLMTLVGLDRVLSVRTDGPAPGPAAGGQRLFPSAGPLRTVRRVGSLPANDDRRAD